MQDYSLCYWDRRLEEAEVVRLLEPAWDEFLELEQAEIERIRNLPRGRENSRTGGLKHQ
jgi:hypothetical protein